MKSIRFARRWAACRSTARDPVNLHRRTFIKQSAVALVAAGFATDEAVFADTTPPPSFAIRTITAGITINPNDSEAVIEEAKRFLDTAERAYQTAGFVVQTKRITTQAHADFLAKLPQANRAKLLTDLKAQVGEGYLLSVGPGITADDDSPDAVATIRGNAAQGITSTISIGTRATGIHHRAIAAAAEVIAVLARTDPVQNFSFGAIANVPPGVPFFPGGFHDGAASSFTVGTQGAGLFMRVCKESDSLVSAKQALIEQYSAELQVVEQIAMGLADDGNPDYAGIDTTPAPWRENSIGTAVESLIGAPFGSPGTLAACEMLTSVIKQVPVKRTGYQGLFLPPLEDATLARRAFDHYGLAALLSYSAVCGTGLDAVAIPGDTSDAQLRRILTDVAALAIRLNKPLTARLFPVPGKQAGDSTGPIGDLFPMKILRVG